MNYIMKNTNIAALMGQQNRAPNRAISNPNQKAQVSNEDSPSDTLAKGNATTDQLFLQGDTSKGLEIDQMREEAIIMEDFSVSSHAPSKKSHISKDFSKNQKSKLEEDTENKDDVDMLEKMKKELSFEESYQSGQQYFAINKYGTETKNKLGSANQADPITLRQYKTQKQLDQIEKFAQNPEKENFYEAKFGVPFLALQRFESSKIGNRYISLRQVAENTPQDTSQSYKPKQSMNDILKKAQSNVSLRFSGQVPAFNSPYMSGSTIANDGLSKISFNTNSMRNPSCYSVSAESVNPFERRDQGQKNFAEDISEEEQDKADSPFSDTSQSERMSQNTVTVRSSFYQKWKFGGNGSGEGGTGSCNEKSQNGSVRNPSQFSVRQTVSNQRNQPYAKSIMNKLSNYVNPSSDKDLQKHDDVASNRTSMSNYSYNPKSSPKFSQFNQKSFEETNSDNNSPKMGSMRSNYKHESISSTLSKFSGKNLPHNSVRSTMSNFSGKDLPHESMRSTLSNFSAKNLPHEECDNSDSYMNQINKTIQALGRSKSSNFKVVHSDITEEDEEDENNEKPNFEIQQNRHESNLTPRVEQDIPGKASIAPEHEETPEKPQEVDTGEANEYEANKLEEKKQHEERINKIQVQARRGTQEVIDEITLREFQRLLYMLKPYKQLRIVLYVKTLQWTYFIYLVYFSLGLLYLSYPFEPIYVVALPVLFETKTFYALKELIDKVKSENRQYKPYESRHKFLMQFRIILKSLIAFITIFIWIYDRKWLFLGLVLYAIYAIFSVFYERVTKFETFFNAWIKLIKLGKFFVIVQMTALLAVYNPVNSSEHADMDEVIYPMILPILVMIPGYVIYLVINIVKHSQRLCHKNLDTGDTRGWTLMVSIWMNLQILFLVEIANLSNSFGYYLKYHDSESLELHIKFSMVLLFFFLLISCCYSEEIEDHMSIILDHEVAQKAKSTKHIKAQKIKNELFKEFILGQSPDDGADQNYIAKKNTELFVKVEKQDLKNALNAKLQQDNLQNSQTHSLLACNESRQKDNDSNEKVLKGVENSEQDFKATDNQLEGKNLEQEDEDGKIPDEISNSGMTEQFKRILDLNGGMMPNFTFLQGRKNKENNEENIQNTSAKKQRAKYSNINYSGFKDRLSSGTSIVNRLSSGTSIKSKARLTDIGGGLGSLNTNLGLYKDGQESESPDISPGKKNIFPGRESNMNDLSNALSGPGFGDCSQPSPDQSPLRSPKKVAKISTLKVPCWSPTKGTNCLDYQMEDIDEDDSENSDQGEKNDTVGSPNMKQYRQENNEQPPSENQANLNRPLEVPCWSPTKGTNCLDYQMEDIDEDDSENSDQGEKNDTVGSPNMKQYRQENNEQPPSENQANLNRPLEVPCWSPTKGTNCLDYQMEDIDEDDSENSDQGEKNDTVGSPNMKQYRQENNEQPPSENQANENSYPNDNNNDRMQNGISKISTYTDYKIKLDEVIYKNDPKVQEEVIGQEEVHLCVFCCSEEPNAINQDCGHGGVCYTCAVGGLTSSTQCHYCREPILKILMIDIEKSFKNLYCVERVLHVQKYILSIKMEALLNRKLELLNSSDDDF